MPATACTSCPHQAECPVRCVRGRYVVEHTAKERRLAGRRREQATDAFREHYAIRAGIESTNSGLKRRTGLGRLRCRSAPRVFHTILLKVCGWNLLRATATEAMHRWVAEKLARTVWNAILKPVGALESVWNRLRPPERIAWPNLHPVRPNSGPEPYRLVA
jgi:hypothetical protein